MASSTTNYSFTLPAVASATDADLWGGQLNSNWTSLDSLLFTATNSVTRSVNSGPVSTSTTDRNKLILVDASGGAITVNLLAAATAGDGFRVAVKKVDSSSNNVTIDGNSSETIDGATTLLLDGQYDSVVLVSNGSNWFVAAEKNPTADTIPVGSMTVWTTTTAPAGWLLCYGQEVSETTYAGLFAVVGTTFNTGGEAGGNFRVPDMRGRAPFGKDDMGGTPANRISGGTTIGGTGGAETYTLTTSELPAHTHSITTFFGSSSTGTDGRISTANTNVGPQTAGATGSSGSGAAFNKMPPYMLFSWIIKT